MAGLCRASCFSAIPNAWLDSCGTADLHCNWSTSRAKWNALVCHSMQPGFQPRSPNVAQHILPSCLCQLAEAMRPNPALTRSMFAAAVGLGSMSHLSGLQKSIVRTIRSPVLASWQQVICRNQLCTGQCLYRQMKRMGSGQLMVTEGDKVLTTSHLGLIGASRPVASPIRQQQLFLHSIQEDGSSQVTACTVFHWLAAFMLICKHWAYLPCARGMQCRTEQLAGKDQAV